MQESQYRMNALPNDVGKMETLIHDHDANKPTVLELFKFSNTEAETLIKKINEAVSIYIFSVGDLIMIITYSDLKLLYIWSYYNYQEQTEPKIVKYLHIILLQF